MPYRYTDVNIKLHQYQGWKRGGLRVLRGFKETVLAAKGKQTSVLLVRRGEHHGLKIETSCHISLSHPPQMMLFGLWNVSEVSLSCFNKAGNQS